MSAGPGRLVAIALAGVVGVWCRSLRRRADGATLAAGCVLATGVVFAIRCLTESVMVPFYLFPALAIGLVLAFRKPGVVPKVGAVGVAVFVTVCSEFPPRRVGVVGPHERRDAHGAADWNPVKDSAAAADTYRHGPRAGTGARALVGLHPGESLDMAQVVGLDIGTSAVRAAELEFGSGTPSLVAFGQVGLPPGAIVDGEVQDESAVSDAIVRLWQNGKFQSKSVVVGIAGLRAITRELDLPWVPDEDVDSAVRFQSEDVIPFPPDKTILSAQVLADNVANDGTKTRRVLVAAAHRDLVDGVVGATEKAGLIVEGVDLVSSALVRALGDPSVVAERPEAIVSIGAGLTVVVVQQAGRPQFVRTIGTGGNAATAAIAGSLDLPLVDAEAIKRRLGEGSAQVRSAESAVQSAITELAGEIRNSVQYFATLPDRAPIARVLVTGGGARLLGLVRELRTQVRIPVEPMSPLARLDLSRIDLSEEQAASIDPVLAAPIGLALPEPNASVKKFNLVPPEVIQRARERQIAKKATIAAAVVVLLLVGVSAWRFLQVHSARNGVEGLQPQSPPSTTRFPPTTRWWPSATSCARRERR